MNDKLQKAFEVAGVRMKIKIIIRPESLAGLKPGLF
jgi:hypothetical protein